MDTIYVNTSKTIWDSLPVWLSAIGTLSAVITSLYFSRKGSLIYGKVNLQKQERSIMFPILLGPPRRQFIIISIINTGFRPFTIVDLSFQWKNIKLSHKSDIFEKKEIPYDPTDYSPSENLPLTITDGKPIIYEISLSVFIYKFLSTIEKKTKYSLLFSLRSYRFCVKTSHGKIFYARLPKELRKDLFKELYIGK
jgi:hypothetical protein